MYKDNDELLYCSYNIIDIILYLLFKLNEKHI